jgi:hypothetical protein
LSFGTLLAPCMSGIMQLGFVYSEEKGLVIFLNKTI